MITKVMERGVTVLGSVALLLLALGGPLGVSWAITSGLLLAGAMVLVGAAWAARWVVLWARRPGRQ